MHRVGSLANSGILRLIWTAPFQTSLARSEILGPFCFVYLCRDQFSRDETQVSILLKLLFLRHSSLAALIAAGPALTVVRVLSNAYAAQHRPLRLLLLRNALGLSQLELCERGESIVCNARRRHIFYALVHGLLFRPACYDVLRRARQLVLAFHDQLSLSCLQTTN